MNATTALWSVIGLCNLAGLIIVAVDKSKARRHRWRISERALFGVAVLGGSIGVYGGCLLFRHKTKHLRFMIGLPAIIAAQGLLAYYFRLL